MVKANQRDVRAALKDILSAELAKEHRATAKKQSEIFYNESYTDECPYCNALVSVVGKNEGTERKTLHGKLYLVAPCKKCEKPVFVTLTILPPASMLGEPTVRASFVTEAVANGTIEGQKPTVTKLKGGLFNN